MTWPIEMVGHSFLFVDWIVKWKCRPTSESIIFGPTHVKTIKKNQIKNYFQLNGSIWFYEKTIEFQLFRNCHSYSSDKTNLKTHSYKFQIKRWFCILRTQLNICSRCFPAECICESQVYIITTFEITWSIQFIKKSFFF